MKKINKDGLILCDLQARAFEMSLNMVTTSSEIFMRRFMNSEVAKILDNGAVLQSNLQARDLIEMIEEEYGKSRYGSVKYARNEMFWIGYLYRYFAFTYELSSLRVYKLVKPKELRGLFHAYHTMDCAQAIERILEAKNISCNEEDNMKRQYEIYKKIAGRYKD